MYYLYKYLYRQYQYPLLVSLGDKYRMVFVVCIVCKIGMDAQQVKYMYKYYSTD